MAAKKRSDRISIELSMYLKYLHKREYVKIRDLWRMYPQLSLTTVYRHATAEVMV